MPTVGELSALYGNFMFGPRPGPGVCRICFNLTDGWDRCYACAHGGRELDRVVPISYSVAGEQLHHALAGYKRAPAPVAGELALGLAAVLWRWLQTHEQCVAQATGVTTFPLVTIVPSADRRRAGAHPLHSIVGELLGVTRGRYRRLLERSAVEVEMHVFNPARYVAVDELGGEPVLLIDDTWTTGANAQSAAAALKAAGAGPVAAVVLGRHINRCWRDNDARLRAVPSPFQWDRCAVCAGEPRPVAAKPGATSPTQAESV
ncbi:MAG: hypothetical protein ACYCXW_16515 [Solirubrobacteraceae bacterium]